MRLRSKLLALVGGITTAVLILAGCLPTATPWAGTSGTRVGLVGDSQMYQLEHDTLNDANHHMTDALVALGYQVSTSDNIGANTGDLAAFETSTPKAGFPTPGAQVSVTVLGVNDMHAVSAGVPGTPYATAEANYAAWLDALATAGVGCHVLVEIPETTPWGLDQTGPPWNAFIDSQTSTRHVVVVPWASIVAQNPSYVGSDGVHQTTAGKAAFLAAIETAVAQCDSGS